jgi:hypothetical protein
MLSHQKIDYSLTARHVKVMPPFFRKNIFLEGLIDSKIIKIQTVKFLKLKVSSKKFNLKNLLLGSGFKLF